MSISSAVGKVLNEMKIKIPKLSLRNTMKRGHTARLHAHGGYLRSTTTGAKFPVFEKDGVYHLKVRVLPPPPMSDAPTLGFARPGR